ncbi:hypothetical protein [Arthrobacter polaris]|uniref:hypothetical protein n=1 Tax=Arthrobacter polaris TaxID=2813727 RepID=UPI001F47D780|nr:hypothetical protein [Arthrobacter polaris]UIK89069.1 hypothetical protein J0916_00775 [Arthrobacter polaris]
MFSPATPEATGVTEVDTVDRSPEYGLGECSDRYRKPAFEAPIEDCINIFLAGVQIVRDVLKSPGNATWIAVAKVIGAVFAAHIFSGRAGR